MIHVCFRKGGHPAYNDILNYPPEGIVYKEVKLVSGKETPFVPLSHKIKRFLFKIYRETISNVNAIPIFCDGDIIYSCGIMAKSSKPWVSDFEHGYNLIGGIEYKNNKKRIISTINHIKKSKCKLLAWSYAALKSVQIIFKDKFKEIKEKFDVVYPALRVDNISSEKKSYDTINFLYINRVFWGKCGLETLLAFDSISKKYDVKLFFISNTPSHIKRKFENNKKIIFIEAPIPRENVFEYYMRSHIFVLPTLFDTFGYVYLEAMNFGLPIIATNIFAVPEIVENEKNGILVEPEYSLFKEYDYMFENTNELYIFSMRNPQYKLVERLKEAMIRLIENDKEREKFGKYSRYLVEKGKFSINYRNKKLKEIFEELVENR